MKAKYAILLLALGYGLDFAGAFLKVTHRAGTDGLFLIAALCKIAGILLLVYKIIRYAGFKNFMDS